MNQKFIVIFGFICILLVISYFGVKFFSPLSLLTSGINVKKFGTECEYAGQCGNIVAINCRAEVDGPFYYVEKNRGNIIEYCGGYCEANDPTGIYCHNCPPKGWNCK